MCSAEKVFKEGAEQTEVGGSFLMSEFMKHKGYHSTLWKDPHLPGVCSTVHLFWQEGTRCELAWLIPRA